VPAYKGRQARRFKAFGGYADGVYILSVQVAGLEQFGTTFKIKSSLALKTLNVFIVEDISTNGIVPISDQDVQDKILAAILAEPQSRIRQETIIKERIKKVPDNYVALPVLETRFTKRLREAANCPDGLYVLEKPVPGLEEYGVNLRIERTNFKNRRFLFVTHCKSIEQNSYARIKDQEVQDKLFSAIMADPKAGTRYQNQITELADQTKDIPAGHYAVDGTGPNSTNFFVVWRALGDGAVTIYQFFDGRNHVSASLSQQIDAAKRIKLAPRLAAERFASELGLLFCCARPLPNGTVPDDGICLACKEKNERIIAHSGRNVV